MRPKELDIDPANANLTGYLSNAQGAGPWTMTTTSSGDGLAHQVSIRNDAAVDYSGQTFTLVGTDADGRPQSDVVTGPNVSATVESAKYFKTLLTSTASGAGTGTDTFDYGWVDEVASQTIPLNHLAGVPPTIEVNLTGTAGYDIEVSMRNPWGLVYNTDDQEDLAWVNDANWTAKSADLIDDLALAGFRSMRVVINSYTDTAEMQVYIVYPSAGI